MAKLVSAADEETMLAEVAAGFEKLAADRGVLAAYRAESEEMEQLRAISHERLSQRLGSLRPKTLEELLKRCRVLLR
jgi:hypothetical protein